jgi:hypothetical protein
VKTINVRRLLFVFHFFHRIVNFIERLLIDIYSIRTAIYNGLYRIVVDGFRIRSSYLIDSSKTAMNPSTTIDVDARRMSHHSDLLLEV